MWPDRRVLDLFKIELPIVLAPMAGASISSWRWRWRRPAASARSPARCSRPTRRASRSRKFRAAHRRAGQCQLLLSHAAGTEQRARSALARAAEALITRSSASIPRRRCRRSNRAPFDAAFCAMVEEIKARGRELPFRPAVGRPVGAGEGGRLPGARLRHHGGRSALAGRARRRCGRSRKALRRAAIAACS